ncbi:MAG TPA: B12-binding domain-containing radical SAM protein, partial [Candidatus Latescibacteria bacterium]|nr:B12-binding domain-containing radical SAM protein [Candidatus Latescibacterota bacterium]
MYKGQNVLLVYPEYPDTFWSFKHALKFVSKKATFPPLGLLTVAAMLPKGWEKPILVILECDQLAWA